MVFIFQNTSYKLKLKKSLFTVHFGYFSRPDFYFFFFSLKVRGPPAAGAFKERPTKPTAFRKFYERGDFPIALEHDSKGNKIAWKVSQGTAWRTSWAAGVTCPNAK